MCYDADGQYVGAVLRYDLPDGKAIRPLHKGPDGRWRIGAMPEPRPLYNLPRLLKADATAPVVITEGEKAAHALQRMLDLAKAQAVVTTSSGGAEAARKTDWKPLSGRQVILWPDNDEAGRRYAAEVAGILRGLGCSVRVFDPAQRFKLPEGFDAADAMANLQALDCVTYADLAQRLLAEAEPWKPSDNPVSTAKAAALTALAEVEAQAVAWLWPSRIPLGCVTLVCGRPGVGKSFFTCDLAARVSAGQKWPDTFGFGNAPQGDVLLIAAEDDAGRTIRPRCEAAKADLRRIHVLAMPAFTLADLQALRASADKLPDLKLVILDPITHYLPGRTDLHRDNEVREALSGLAVWASERNLAVVLIAHNRKAASEYADDSVLGSRALSALPRAVHHVFFDPDAEGRRLFLPGKCNLAAPPLGLAFGIGGEPARVQWERLPVDVKADDVIRMVRTASRPGPEAKARTAAEDWLRELLANGPLPTEQVQAEAKEAGLCWRTVRRAAETLGVKARKCGFAGGWTWQLPDG